MNDAEAQRRAKLHGAASAWNELGMSVIPLQGKKPAYCKVDSNGRHRFKWRNAMNFRYKQADINRWYELGWLQNIGIVCGWISNNLVVIDLDGAEAVQTFESRWQQLLSTYTILTGSGTGKHLYYYVMDLPPSRRHNGIEIRADGCYVVAPPSIHPDTGQPYKVVRKLPIMELRTMFPVVEWIESMSGDGAGIPEAPVNVALPSSGYGVSAVNGELDRLRAAPDGSRNNQLNLSAFRLGQLVGENVLTQHEVESALLEAALAIGLTEKESAATINSGLTAGIRKPRGRKSWQN